MKKILFLLLLFPLFLIIIAGAIMSDSSSKKTVNDDNSAQEKVDDIIVSGDSELGVKIAQKGLTKLGCQYVWGGGHDMAEIQDPNQNVFDCSSFVCWSHYQSGVDVGTQTTKTLLKMGLPIPYQEIQAGDIILFKLDETVVSHVGIYIGEGKMVHAPNPSLPIKTEVVGSFWQSTIVSCRRLY